LSNYFYFIFFTQWTPKELSMTVFGSACVYIILYSCWHGINSAHTHIDARGGLDLLTLYFTSSLFLTLSLAQSVFVSVCLLAPIRGSWETEAHIYHLKPKTVRWAEFWVSTSLIQLAEVTLRFTSSWNVFAIPFDHAEICSTLSL